MEIKLWGVRGSLPTPLHTDDLRGRLVEAIEAGRADPGLDPQEIIQRLPLHINRVIGGETTCVEVRFGKDQLIIDMGTGARRLGYDMMARGHKGDVHILITHTHWDHIQGWPFFVPGFVPGNTVHFYSCHDHTRERFIHQQHPNFFPVTFEEMRSTREFHEYKPGEPFQVGPFQIDTRGLKHPGGSTAYRIRTNGRTFIFATDTEFFGPDLPKDVRDYMSFFGGVDLLIMDAQYSLLEAEQRVGWGHTAMKVAVGCALEWNVKKLVLTHHEPAHNDEKIRALYEETRAHLESIRGQRTLEIELATQDAVFAL